MIVITTPTGRIGHQVLADVLEMTDESVRVLVRDAATLSDEIRERVEIVEGSSDDIDIVNTAFTGADVVFWVVPGDDTADNLQAHYQKFNQVAADAIRAQHITHLVWVSTLGHDTGKPSGHLAAALAADKVLEETGVAARILAPATFMDNLLWQARALKGQGAFSLVNEADKVLNNIATADIAKEAAQLLVHRDWQGQQRVPLVGPDDLTPNQMAEIMSEVIGKPIAFQQLEPETFKKNMMQFGSSDAVAQGLMEMAMAVNDGFYKEESDITERTSTSFREWCENALKPLDLL